jgi:CubicO group peptidase (beta-lactamase class C family)
MPHSLTRRSLIRTVAGATAASLLPLPLRAQGSNGDQLPGAQRGQINRLVAEFKRQFSDPALSIAITRNGQFVFDKAFGVADRDQATLANTDSIFRIASVTKPITSTTIFSLIEQGKLHLNDKVFGPGSILGNKYSPKGLYKPYVTDITVDQFLTHTSGGWPDDNTDPMFQHDGWDHDKLITWAIETIPVTNPPGTHYAYSNFGYCVLGRVIEQVTGQPYDAYVKANILAPCGITTMQIAANSERDRAPNEVIYYGQYDEQPYKFNITRMDSHGGLIATPGNLVQFLDHVTGAGGLQRILKPETVRLMTTPVPASAPANYARGWAVRNNGNGNWWHNGSLPGSTTIMVRTTSGLCWAALANTRTQPSDQINTALDQLLWNIARTVPQWNA